MISNFYSQVFGFALDAYDHTGIEAVLAKSREKLMKLIGAGGAEDR